MSCVSGILYAAVYYPNRTVAVELNSERRFRTLAQKAVDQSVKPNDYIENLEGYSARLLRDTMTFICIVSKSYGSDKALNYLYDVKNSFAFKFCHGNLAKAAKMTLDEKKADEFREELSKTARKYETGIKRDRVMEANEKIREVATVMSGAIKKQLGSMEGTQHLLEESKDIEAFAKQVEHNAAKMEPSCCQRFWNFSRPCVLIFVVIITAVVVFSFVSVTQCGDMSLFVGKC